MDEFGGGNLFSVLSTDRTVNLGDTGLKSHYDYFLYFLYCYKVLIIIISVSIFRTKQSLRITGAKLCICTEFILFNYLRSEDFQW